MKNALLLVVLSCMAGLSFAQAKPAAKTSPTPKAAVKKAPPPLPDAGEWKPLDVKKGHLAGPEISEADLFCQPVIVVVFDPIWHPDGRVREDEPWKFVRIQGEAALARYQIVSTPSRELSSDEVATFAKDYPKTSGSGPCYANFGLVTPPVNKDMKFPFFYVVTIDKKISYAGERFDQALARALQDARAHKGGHELLGYYEPKVLADKVGELKFGEPIAKTVQKLKPIAAAKKESDEKTDAESILKVLKQSKTHWVKVCQHTLGNKPPLGALMCYQAVKTFASPKDKEAFKAMAGRVEAAVGKQSIKLYQTLYAYNEKLPEKKADLKKAQMDVKKGEQAVAKAKKQFGDKVPPAFMTLEELVLEVKGKVDSALEEAK